MSIRWVLLETVLAVHDRQISDHGGLPGIRERGLIESAVERPRTIAKYEDQGDIFDLAAAYGYGLLQNHGFHDGNKRTAYTITRLFLELNGWTLTAPAFERVLVFVKAADHGFTERDLAEWLRNNSEHY